MPFQNINLRIRPFVVFGLLLAGGHLCSLGQPNPDSLQATSLFKQAEQVYLAHPDSGIYYFEQSRLLFEQSGSWKPYIVCCFALYATHRINNDFENALFYLQEAEKKSLQHLGENSLHYAISLNNLGDYYFIKGDYPGALHIFLKAYEIVDTLKPRQDQMISNLWLNIGACHRNMGDYEEALRYNLLSLEHILQQAEERSPQAGLSYQNIATNYRYLEQYEEAITYLRKAIRAFQGDPRYFRELVNSHNSLAMIYLTRSMADSAAFHLARSKKVQARYGPHLPQVNFELAAELALIQEDHDEALENFNKALDERFSYFSGREKHIEIAESFQRLGDTYRALGRSAEALCAYQDALDAMTYTFEQVGDPLALPHSSSFKYPLEAISCLDNKAQALIKRNQEGDPDAALACYLLVDTLVNRALLYLKKDGSKLSFYRKIHPVFERAISLCISLNQQSPNPDLLPLAFHFAEKNRAALLLESLQELGAKLSGGIPDSLIEREQELKVDITFYQNKLFRTGKNNLFQDSTHVRWRAILFEKEEQYRELIRYLEVQFPAYYSLKYGHRTISVETIQNALQHPDHMLAAYFWGDSSIFLFAITQDRLEVQEVVRDSTVDSQIAGMLNHLHFPSQRVEDLRQYAGDSYALYQKLLEPVLDDQFPSQLVIIPAGQLCYLPFETLLQRNPALPQKLDQRAVALSYRELPYLFKQTELRYAYSATLLYQNPLSPSQATKRFAAFAPSYSGNLTLNFNQPHALEVAERIGGDAFVGDAATESAFKTYAPDYDLLHLVMHGQPNEETPLYARLLFSEEADSSEDGSLYAYELYNLRLNARLAVLAACESGYGKLEQGEGIFSLARAFRYAGCPSLLYSHWTADSRVAWRMLTTFYDQLRRGTGKAQALQAARKKFLAEAEPDMTHPFYWAPYVLSGDDTPLRNPFDLHLAYPAAALFWMALALWRRRE